MRVARWVTYAFATASCLATIVAGAGPYDVVMMLDASASPDDFQQTKALAKAIGNSFNVGQGTTDDRVTAFTFHSKPTKKQDFWKTKDTKNLERHINSMSRKKPIDPTNLPYAIDSAVQLLNKSPRGAFEVIIFLSDGVIDMPSYKNSLVGRFCSNIRRGADMTESNILECMRTALASAVKQEGAFFIFVPVTSSTAFPPSALAEYVHTPSDLTDASSITSGVIQLIEEASTSKAAIGCEDGADILFVLQGSDVVSGPELDAAHNFVTDFASRWVGDARFGLIEYATGIDETILPVEEGTGARFVSSEVLTSGVASLSRPEDGLDDTNMPLVFYESLDIITGNNAQYTEEDLSSRSTFLIHVGDDVPSMKFKNGRLPTICPGYGSSKGYNQKAKKCTRLAVKEIQKVATYVAVRIGNEPGSGGLYKKLQPSPMQFGVSDYAGLGAIIDQMVTKQCVNGLTEITLSPTSSPTNSPTISTTPEPTDAPTDSPTPAPTNAPTESPTPAPTNSPTPEPTDTPTDSPTPEPTESPTPEPTNTPTNSPTPEPTDAPTDSPTPEPTDAPTDSPTPEPTNAPTDSPTPEPTNAPTDSPTNAPTDSPTSSPTTSPTDSPTNAPTPTPTDAPTESPTFSPVDIFPGCYEEEIKYKPRTRETDFEETIDDDASIQFEEQCQAKCVETEECLYWSFRAPRNGNGENAVARCVLMSAVQRLVVNSTRWTGGPRVCTQAPTMAPTLSPVVSYPECYNTTAINKPKKTAFYLTLEDDEGVQEPEQCHSKCIETENCNFWSFRSPRNGDGANAAALCNLMKKVKVVDPTDSTRWTSGPKECTEVIE
ncbi:Hypothetical Protein FCC1311_105702 [Hondaea fermentalgiana]|uniref:VWFA domain-containing protein n=1 Tax=Hondaea fermentalgiana TaxID=2315210 RepID=A0A2R5GTZ6_9STRA|nr:Hypothetical Protein FCC1311_105702 [Hondaea fermentalgiana]|eukprot:GBG34347.1 Hypothetical Protein FCC1311_105702 [Hondaea fermentalgiana]